MRGTSSPYVKLRGGTTVRRLRLLESAVASRLVFAKNWVVLQLPTFATKSPRYRTLDKRERSRRANRRRPTAALYIAVNSTTNFGKDVDCAGRLNGGRFILMALG